MPEFAPLPDHLVDQARAVDMLGLVRQRVRLVREGPLWVGLCPFHSEKTGSFKVDPNRNTAKCYGCGWSGDPIGFTIADRGVSFREAVLALTGGAAPPAPARPAPARANADRPRTQSQARDRGLRLWRESQPAGGTLLEAYWAARGLLAPVPPSLRFHPALPFNVPHPETGDPVCLGTWPAMIAAVSCNQRLLTVHRTYLERDGSAKARIRDPFRGRPADPKKLAGSPGLGAIMLTEARPRMLLGEGVETTWAAWGRVGPAWGAMSAIALGRLAGAGDPEGWRRPHPTLEGRRLPTEAPDLDRPGMLLPDGVEELVLLRDADSTDMAAIDAQLARAVRRWARGGRVVRIVSPPTGADFADFNLALAG